MLRAVVALLSSTLLAACIVGPSGSPVEPEPSSEPPAAFPFVPAVPPVPSDPPVEEPVALTMAFGIDAPSVAAFTALAGAPDYGTLWVGAWNLQWGWKEVEPQLVALRDANVTPAVQFYYWGNDIEPSCFSEGCGGKSVQGWTRLAEEFTAVLTRSMGDRPVLVLLESEFNKNDVERDDVSDGLLADEAAALKRGYPPAQVVLAFGNWNPAAWDTWDRAAAASDFVGVQALTASTRYDDDHQVGMANATVEAAARLHDLFGKPVIIQDLGVSSYPEPDKLAVQADAVEAIAEQLSALQEAGVVAVLYRALRDTPTATTDEYFGEAERHWGLAWKDGLLKPAGEVWVGTVREARGLPVA